MAIYGKSFIFNGQSSDMYNIILASFRLPDTFEMGLSRSLITGEMNKYRTSRNYNGWKYSDVLQFEFSIIKDPCKTNDITFSRKEVRDINRWLLGSDIPSVLSFADDDDEPVEYICNITNVEDDLAQGKIAELRYSVECNSPYAYTPVQTFVYDVSDSLTFDLNCDSDEVNGYVYPIITINPKSSGVVIVTNNEENRCISIDAKRSLPIHINCQLQQFYDDIGLLDFSDLGLEDESDIYIPRLKSGNNIFSVTGNCTIKFSFRCPRKVGAY